MTTPGYRTPNDTVNQGADDQAVARVQSQTPALDALRRSVDLRTALNAHNLARIMPEASPQLLASVVRAGFSETDVETPGFLELRRRDAAANEGNWFGIKRVFRGGFLGAEALYQSAIRNQRLVVNLAQGDDIAQAWRDSGSTYLDEVIRTARRGDPINIGSGWTARSTQAHNMPGFDNQVLTRMQMGQSPDEAWAAATEAMYASEGQPLTEIVDTINETTTQIYKTTADGEVIAMPWSFGRFVANQFVAPDTMPYQLISGAVDGYHRIFADPIDVPLIEVARWRGNLGRMVPSGGDEALRNAWDEWLRSHNIIVASADTVDIPVEAFGHEPGGLLGVTAGSAEEVEQIIGLLETAGVSLDQNPAALRPIIIWRDNIKQALHRLDDYEPDDIPNAAVIIPTDGGPPVPGTFENVAASLGLDPADLPEWTKGLNENPYAQAHIDEGMTAGDLRETIYLQGGQQTMEDFVLEHELWHAEAQSRHMVDVNAAQAQLADALGQLAHAEDLSTAELAQAVVAQREAALEVQRLNYLIEREASRKAIQNLRAGNLSASKWRQAAYQDYGVSRWWRPWIKTHTVDDWLQSDKGQQIIEYAAETRSYQDIDQLFPKIRPEDKVFLTDTTDPADVIDIMYQYGGTPRMQTAPRLTRRQRLAGRRPIAGETVIPKGGPLAGMAATVRDYGPTSSQVRRWLAQSGDMVLDPFNIDQSVTAARNWLYTIGAHVDEVDDFLYRIADSGGNIGVLHDIWSDMTDLFRIRLNELGYQADEVATIMEDFAQNNYHAKLYFDNLAGHNVLLYRQGTFTTRDGTQLVTLSGHLPSEFSHSFIVMPSMREMRRATNKMRSVIQKVRRHYPSGWAWADNINDPLGLNPNLGARLLDPAASLWRNSALMRIGWPMRVLPEEMIRMWADGYSQAIRHPFSYLALMFSDTKGAVDILGNSLDDVFTAKALGSGAFQVDWANAIRGTAFDATNTSWSVVRVGEDGYDIGLGREILDLAMPEVSARVARDGWENTLDWLMNDPDGWDYLNEIIADSASGSVWRNVRPYNGPVDETVLRSIMQSIEARITKNTGGHYIAREISPQTALPTGRWVDDYGNPLPLDRYRDWSRDDLVAELRDRQITGRSYLTTKDDMVDALLRDDGYGMALDAADDDFFVVTKVGDGRVREVIGTGTLDGEIVIRPEMSARELRDFERALPGMYTSDEFLPEVVKIPNQSRSRNLAAQYDRLTDQVFHVLMEVPTVQFIRSPYARLVYTDNVAQAYIFSTPATRSRIEAWVDEVGMRVEFDESVAKHLRELNLRGLPDEVTDAFDSFDDVDRMAKAMAIEDTKTLFYDLAQRGNWADATRLIFPFADAWWEVMSRWAKFLDPTGLVPGRKPGAVAEAMRNSRKAQVVVSGARESGFFSEDKFGNEVFNWPGFGLLAGNFVPGMGGVGFGATMSLESLMFIDPTARGIIAPGTGPFAQIAAHRLIPKLPRQIQPFLTEAVYGEYEPERINEIGDLVLEFAPTWVRRLAESVFPNYRQVYADEITGLFASTYLSNNPLWGDGGKVSATQRLEWAQRNGSALGWLRILDAFVSPGQPRYEPQVLLDSFSSPQAQVWVQYQALADEYRIARSYYGSDVAAQMYMLENFGVDPLDIVPESIGVVDRPSTGDAYLWLEDHAELRSAAPFTLMAWVPLDDADEFSWQAFHRQFHTDEDIGAPARQRMTPQMAQYWLNRAKGFRAWDTVNALYDEALQSAESDFSFEPNRLRDYRAELNDWKAKMRDSIHARYWAWGFDRNIPGQIEPPSYRVLFDEMASLPTKPEIVALDPELAEWVSFTTDLWRQAEEASVDRGSDLNWWRSQTPESGEPQRIREWFYDGVEWKASQLPDESKQGAEWYMQQVLAPLLNGVEWNDRYWFELEQPPDTSSTRVLGYDQLQQFEQLPGNQMPVPGWMAEREVAAP